MSDTLDKQTRQLAGMAYGEASPKDNADEMFAIASILVRQRDARGYKDMKTFTLGEPSFSYVVSDHNKRYHKLINATTKEIEKNYGMKTAVEAARNALNGGPDKSNGAYFWDGADIKSHYETHSKVKHGIKFSDASHNIYGLKESIKIVIKYKNTKKKNIKTGQITILKEEIGRYDHVYESTAACGGTIFWKISKNYIDVMHAKEYK